MAGLQAGNKKPSGMNSDIEIQTIIDILKNPSKYAGKLAVMEKLQKDIDGKLAHMSRWRESEVLKATASRQLKEAEETNDTATKALRAAREEANVIGKTMAKRAADNLVEMEQNLADAATTEGQANNLLQKANNQANVLDKLKIELADEKVELKAQRTTNTELKKELGEKISLVQAALTALIVR